MVERPDADAAWLLALAGRGAPGRRGSRATTTSSLTHDLASRGGRRRPGLEIEILLGSYDRPGARLLDLVEVMDRCAASAPGTASRPTSRWSATSSRRRTRRSKRSSPATATTCEEELGDLLLQVMFHARVASEHPDAPFDIDDVAAGIVDKLVRRHPHVFGDADAPDAATVEANWETIKNAEKGRESAMDGIPLGPACAEPRRQGRRAGAQVRRSSCRVPSPAETAYDADVPRRGAVRAGRGGQGRRPRPRAGAAYAGDAARWQHVRVQEQRASSEEPDNPR